MKYSPTAGGKLLANYYLSVYVENMQRQKEVGLFPSQATASFFLYLAHNQFGL